MTTVSPSEDHRQDIDALRNSWKHLYTTELPSLARAKDLAQPKWPVTLDHCFARIILDNTIGSGTKQWDKVIPRPAVMHMTARQFQAAIDMGEKIKIGQADLVDLDRRSLQARGKHTGKYGNLEAQKGKKRIIVAEPKNDESLNQKRRRRESENSKTQSKLNFRSNTDMHSSERHSSASLIRRRRLSSKLQGSS